MKKYTILLLFALTALCADSFVGLENYPQIADKVPDYTAFHQTTLVENGEVGDILYPTLAFPAIISPEDRTMSVLFHCAQEPLGVTVMLSREINEKRLVFLTKEADTVAKLSDQNICKIEIAIPAVLPATVFDLTIRLVGGVSHFSRHSVGFIKSGPIRFTIFADPQIEDLQAKNATGMNYNNKSYPGYSSDVLDYSIQEGIIGVSIAQNNISNLDFFTSVGDVVFGINYQDEYRQMADFILKSEIPFFATPGNHDGYARFNQQNDFQSGVLYDGLNYWRAFFGPVSSAFTVKGKTFIMLNTYSGTAERRASGAPIGIGNAAAAPVSNFGGFLPEASQQWVDALLQQVPVTALFSHQLPLGLPGKDEPYDAMEKFPANSIIGAINFEEWNFESEAYDSDLSDSILNETMTFNTGTRLAFSLSLYGKPVTYFSGHAHVDRNLCYEKGETLIPNSDVKAGRDICFYQTTTAATEGSHYWGMRPVTIDGEAVSANYMCEDNSQCYPTSEKHQGFQSMPTGNLWAVYRWAEKENIYLGGDGVDTIVRATVTSFLPKKHDVFLRFVMPANPSGYAIDSDDFVIDDIALSEDKSVAYIILRGSIDAGSTEEQFYDKDFHKTEVEVTLKKEIGSSDGLHPTIVCPDEVFRGEKIACSVENSKDYTRFVWKVNDILVSGEEAISFSSNKCSATCDISVQLFDKFGRFGDDSTSVAVNEQPLEEPDEQPEIDEIPDEDSVDDDFSSDEDVENKPVKTGSCSALFVQ